MQTLTPLLTDADIQADKLRLARLLADALARSTDPSDRRRLAGQRDSLQADRPAA